MTITIDKLDKLCIEKGFQIKNYYIMYDKLVFLELLKVDCAEYFMIYIPSKYSIDVTKKGNVYEVEYFDLPDETTNNIDDIYEEVDLDVDIDNLSSQYMADINLHTTETSLHEIKRQISRLSLCVKSINYNLCIIYEDKIFHSRENYIYKVKNFSDTNTKRKLVLCLDLKSFLNKINVLHKEIPMIKKGIYKILNKNYYKQSALFNELLENKKFLQKEIPVEIQNNHKHIEKLSQLYNNIKDTEAKKKQDMDSIIKLYSNKQGFHNDIEKTRKISNIQSQLDKISNTKEKIISSLLEIKEYTEDYHLTLDKICFDNIMMINNISNNLDKI